jgi:predicted RecB family nuclease
MDRSDAITAAVFAAFLKCPTKAHLLMFDELSRGTLFTDLQAQISSMYEAASSRQFSAVDFADALGVGDADHTRNQAAPRRVDCKSTLYDLAPPPYILEGRPLRTSSPSNTFLPILFSPWEKPEVSDSLLLCFGALALFQATGILAETGTLIYGDAYRHKTVRIQNFITRTRQIIDSIRTFNNRQEPPPLVLNRHCAVCDFQSRCRSVATDRDDLSLLSAMTPKDRAKCNAKGISTITQLSYGYRPRRRKRTKPDAERAAKSAKRIEQAAKNNHKLKGLAIKKSQIHVVGSPSLTLKGVQVFLDIEGMPDRDFYYLVGLRYECNGKWTEQSFWADEPESERKYGKAACEL